MTAKITSSRTQNPRDLDFLTQLRAYLGNNPTHSTNNKNPGKNIQTQLRNFLRKGKS